MSLLLLNSVTELLTRDLTKLQHEIAAYSTTEKLWQMQGEIKNPGGSLCLHICGNLQHYIGAVLGKSGYVRHRDNEFGNREISKEKLLREIETTAAIVSKTLTALNPAALEAEYPEDVFNRPMTTGYFLIHLAGHLNYHLGQINYHRRLLCVGD